MKQLEKSSLDCWMTEELQKTDSLMLEGIRELDSESRAAITALIESGGKRLRPQLVLLCGKTGNPDPVRLRKLAAGIELLHTATLIHDDIIDKARTRRGILTLHHSLSVGQAVIAGDFLLAQSLKLLAVETTTTHSARFLAHILNICKSELHQHRLRCRLIGQREYFKRIYGKTASLFILSCEAGALEGRLSDTERTMLRRYAYNAGMSFQIHDDILDICGNRRLLRKPVGQDLSRGILTLPWIITAQSSETARDLLQQSLKKKGKGLAIRKLEKILKESKAVEKANAKALEYCRRGHTALAQFPETEEKSALKNILDNLIQRSH